MISLQSATVREFHNVFGETRLFYDVYADELGPQAFLVHMHENNIVHPHFHNVDQFQLFFESPHARYQRTPIDSIVVHYADAYTTYGPFKTGDEPLQYYTLRGVSTEFIGYMPQDRKLLVRRGRRNLHRPIARAGELAKLPRTPSAESVFDAQDDGLCCEIVRVGPKGLITGRDPARSGGQYWCVLDGSVLAADREFFDRSLLWTGRDDEPAVFEAGLHGLEVLLMQYPQDAERRQGS